MWVVIQHVSYDGRGGIGPALDRAGLESIDCRPFAGDRLPAVSELSGVFVLGAPAGQADADQPEHLVHERRLIAEAVQRGLPVLGVCFGAQLLAVALGGEVRTDRPLEVGMGEATLTAAGRLDPVLGHADQDGQADRDGIPVLHWHRHGYTLPPGAIRLAISGDATEQAFRLGDRVYGLQFHVEVNPQLAGVIAAEMPPDSLPAPAVADAEAWGAGVLDRFLARSVGSGLRGRPHAAAGPDEVA